MRKEVEVEYETDDYHLEELKNPISSDDEDEETCFRNPNLRKKKQVKKKIFDNFLNFASRSSLHVTIWDNLSHWIVYVTLKLSTMHLTNSNDYFSKLMQR